MKQECNGKLPVKPANNKQNGSILLQKIQWNDDEGLLLSGGRLESFQKLA